MTEPDPANESHPTISEAGATAIGGNVTQRGRNVAGRDQSITNIEQQIVQQGPVLREARYQLLADVEDFTDREDVAAEIRGRLGVVEGRERSTSRVALSGGPGVGKSALAIHIAHQLAAALPDAQLYVNLAGAEDVAPEDRRPVDPQDALAALLRALGVPAEQIPVAGEEREAWYRSELADQCALIVLDNARDDVQVRPLLPGGASCVVLITSRVPLASLEGTWQCELHELDRGASIELLTRLIDSERVDRERDQADQIARLCGDLPLAVRICGGLLNKRPQWTLAYLVAQLSDEHTRLSKLTQGRLNVRASFDVSYQQLSDPQRQLFRRLAVVPGQDFSALVAGGLIDTDDQEADELLEQLLDAQLVESPTAGRFALHDLLRLYARERLVAEDTPEAQEEARRAAVHWYLALAQISEQALTPGATDAADDPDRTRAVLDFVEAETDNLLAAAHDAYAHQDWDTTTAFVYALYDVFELRSRWDAWETVTRLGLQAAQHADNSELQAAMLSHLGTCLHLQGRWHEAIDAYQQSLTIYREVGDRRGEGQILNNLGVVYRAQARWEETVDAYQQSLTIQREVGDRRGEGQTLNNLGVVYQNQGRWDEAIDAYQQSLTIHREFGDRRGEGQALNNLGNGYQQQERWDEAIDAFELSLTISREFGDRRGEGTTLNNLGLVYEQQGRWEEAIDAYQEDLAICREFGDRRGESMTLNNLGLVYQQQGRREEAIDAYQQSLTIKREFGDRLGEGQTVGNLGLVYREQGRREEAIDAFEHSMAAFAATEDHDSEARVRDWLDALKAT